MGIKTIIILMLSTLCLKAQNNFMAPGATWHYLIPEGGWGFPYQEINHTIKYTHDSLFDGKQTKILTGISFAPTNCSCSWYDTLLTYTSNDSVFIHSSRTVHTWELLYNYGATPGSTWNLYLNDMNGIDTISVSVDSIGYTNINAIILKTLYVQYTSINHYNQYQGGGSLTSNYSSYIIDRIGDIVYLFNFFSDCEILADPCYPIHFLCYSDSVLGTYQVDSSKACNYSYTEGIVTHTNNKRFVIWPNPAQISNVHVLVSGFDEQDLKIQVSNMGGSIIKSYAVKEEEQLDIIYLSDIEPGVYIASLLSGHAVLEVKKLIIIE